MLALGHGLEQGTASVLVCAGEDVPDTGSIQRRKALNINFLAQVRLPAQHWRSPIWHGIT